MPVARIDFRGWRIGSKNRTLLADFGWPDDNFPILVGNVPHGANFLSDSLTVEGNKGVSFAVSSVSVFHDFRLMNNAVDFKEAFQLFLSGFVAESFDENTVWDFHIAWTMSGMVILIF